MPHPTFKRDHKNDWRQTGRAGVNSTPNRPKSPGRGWRGWMARIWPYALIVAGLGLFSLIGGFFWLSRGLPDPNQLISRELAQSTKIFDRTGTTVLYEIHGLEKRTLVSLADLPDYVKNATIAIEDKNFYNHKGFSLWAIFRTAITNVLRGQRAGGSTLTQQFIKNAVLTSDKTYTRKLKELIMAYRVEQKFNKNEILQMYLNEIPYGSTAYGVEAASQRYFGKSARDITLAEAAALAAMTQAPTRYSPYGSNRESLMSRQKYVLDLMVEQGYVSAEEAGIAKDEVIEFKKPNDNIQSPHFVMYVKELLTEKYGEKLVEQGGLKIVTTLDLYKQKAAEEAVAEFSERNLDNYQAENAALVSIDPKTGQILAMVGSRDYFNDDIDGQVNITLSPRQPGSSIKPLVYTTAFIKGYTPNTILYDVVTNFSTDPANPYEPKNYNLKELGPVSMRQALAGSLNIPAVKTLYLAGVNSVLDLAEELGYTTLSDRSRFGLALVLGGGEVTLLEHTNAFSAFAREGTIHRPAAILRVEDGSGNVLEEWQDDERRVLEAKTARLTNNVLSDNAARSFIFGEKNYLTLGARPVAAKSGTTNDYRDAWTIGYTPSLVAGVWVGNNDNREMKRGADGSTVAAPIWNKYMKTVLGDTPVETFRAPENAKTGKGVIDGEGVGEIKVKVDRASGLLATELTPADYIEEKVFRADHSILYYVDRNDPLGTPPSDPGLDPQFNLWESRVRAWSEKNGFATATPPTDFDNVHRTENIPTVKILDPYDGQNIDFPVLLSSVQVEAPRGLSRVEYWINNNLIDTVSNYPFNLNKNLSFLPNGYYDLKARACDDVGNCGETKIVINLNLSQSGPSRPLRATWVEPSNGLAVNTIDFPLALKVGVEPSTSVARVNFFYIKTDNSVESIATITTLDNGVAETAWAKVEPGRYQLQAEAVSWTNETAKTNILTITVGGNK